MSPNRINSSGNRRSVSYVFHQGKLMCQDNRSHRNEWCRERQPQLVYECSGDGQNNTIPVAPTLMDKSDEMLHLLHQRLTVVLAMFYPSQTILLLLAKQDNLSHYRRREAACY